MRKKYDYLFVGAGLYNATLATRAKMTHAKCLVIDKRTRLGGNCMTVTHTEPGLNGIVEHKYGAHIFHTSDRNIWSFVNKYATFLPFVNSPIACYRPSITAPYEVYNLPFNMNTFMKIFPGVVTPDDAKHMIERDIASAHIDENQPETLESHAISMV